MERRGQVTLFIIIAIVIVVAALITFFVIRERQRIQLEQHAKVQEIKTFVSDCLTVTMNQSEKEISSHGFYYKVPEDSMLFFLIEIPYFYKNKTIKVPSLSKVEEQFSMAVENNIKECLDNFSNFKTQGIEVLWNYSIETKIKNNSISISTFPIIIRKGGLSTTLLVSTEKKSDLNFLHQLANEIVLEYSKKPGFLCIDCLDESSKKYGAIIKTNALFDQTNYGVYVFSITKENNKDLLLRFVVEI